MPIKILGVLAASIIYGFLLSLVGSPDLSNDSFQYYTYTINLLQTGVYGLTAGIQDMHREPGYVVFLAAVLQLKTWLHLNFDSLRFIVLCQGILLFLVVYLLAFKTFFKGKSRVIFFNLCLLSPTLAGSATVLYSEILAACLMGLFFVGFSNFSGHTFRKIFFLVLAAVSLGSLILTKSYLQFAPYFILIFSAIFYRKIPKEKFFTLLFCAIIALTTQGLWNHRNKQALGANFTRFRMINIFAGKVFQVEKMKLPEDLPKALAASIGTNFCRRIYSLAECSNFDITNADQISSPLEAEYIKKYPESLQLAESHFIKDLAHHYWQHAFLQLVGSFFETIRMAFFESTQRSKERPWLNTLGSAWHFGGSLIFFFLFSLGIRKTFCKANESRPDQSQTPDPESKILLQLSLIFLFYHWVTMSQVTNVVRFIYPMLIPIYFFVTIGISQIIASSAKSNQE